MLAITRGYPCGSSQNIASRAESALSPRWVQGTSTSRPSAWCCKRWQPKSSQLSTAWDLGYHGISMCIIYIYIVYKYIYICDIIYYNICDISLWRFPRTNWMKFRRIRKKTQVGKSKDTVWLYNMTFLIPSTQAEVPGGACVMVRVS